MLGFLNALAGRVATRDANYNLTLERRCIYATLRDFGPKSTDFVEVQSVLALFKESRPWALRLPRERRIAGAETDLNRRTLVPKLATPESVPGYRRLQIQTVPALQTA